MTKSIIALVGMAGSGKSDVAAFLKGKGLPVIRFGEETDTGLKKKDLPPTEENERAYREKLRSQLGMAAYAISAKPKIDEAIVTSNTVILDGLYSWQEYKFIKEQYPVLKVIGIFADRHARYERLTKRSVRPLTKQEAELRDIAEIENLDKAGPIAMADYFLENNGTLEALKEKTEALLNRLGIIK